MGHEYMEMKNTSAAIESYRQAIGTVIFRQYHFRQCLFSKFSSLFLQRSVRVIIVLGMDWDRHMKY